MHINAINYNLYRLSFTSGTRVDDAKAILAASALRMFASDDLDNAAQMVRFK